LLTVAIRGTPPPSGRPRHTISLKGSTVWMHVNQGPENPIIKRETSSQRRTPKHGMCLPTLPGYDYHEKKINLAMLRTIWGLKKNTLPGGCGGCGVFVNMCLSQLKRGPVQTTIEGMVMVSTSSLGGKEVQRAFSLWKRKGRRCGKNSAPTAPERQTGSNLLKTSNPCESSWELRQTQNRNGDRRRSTSNKSGFPAAFKGWRSLETTSRSRSKGNTTPKLGGGGRNHRGKLKGD